MRLVEKYHFPPHLCVRCGSPRTPVVDLETYEDLRIPTPEGGVFGEGRIALCIACAEEMARLLGFVSGAEAEPLFEVAADLRRQLAERDEEMVTLRAFRETMLANFATPRGAQPEPESGGAATSGDESDEATLTSTPRPDSKVASR